MSERPDTTIEESATPLLRAVRKLLRPLVRLLVHHRITYPALSDLLKSLYVEVADQDFPVGGEPPTASRTSMLTGIYRREIQRLRGEQREAAGPSAEPSLAALIVSRWTGDPRFLDAEGEPLPLDRQASAEGRPTFVELVRSVESDIRPRAVLEEWLRLGLVDLDLDGRVVLDPEALSPPRDFAEKCAFFERNLHEHLAAAEHNLRGGEPPMLERSVYYAFLTPASVARLEARARNLGVRALRQLNRDALELQRRDEGDPTALERIHFGVYFHRALLERARRRENEDE